MKNKTKWDKQVVCHYRSGKITSITVGNRTVRIGDELLYNNGDKCTVVQLLDSGMYVYNINGTSDCVTVCASDIFNTKTICNKNGLKSSRKKTDQNNYIIKFRENIIYEHDIVVGASNDIEAVDSFLNKLYSGVSIRELYQLNLKTAKLVKTKMPDVDIVRVDAININ